jgi:hypothetical protein
MTFLGQAEVGALDLMVLGSAGNVQQLVEEMGGARMRGRQIREEETNCEEKFAGTELIVIGPILVLTSECGTSWTKCCIAIAVDHKKSPAQISGGMHLNLTNIFSFFWHIYLPVMKF